MADLGDEVAGDGDVGRFAQRRIGPGEDADVTEDDAGLRVCSGSHGLLSCAAFSDCPVREAAVWLIGPGVRRCARRCLMVASPLNHMYCGQTSEHREVAAAASWGVPRQGQ